MHTMTTTITTLNGRPQQQSHQHNNHHHHHQHPHSHSHPHPQQQYHQYEMPPTGKSAHSYNQENPDTKTPPQARNAATKTGSTSSSRHLVGALNTRKIGKKHRITLKKSTGGGFGIKIAERDNMYGPNKPIFITAITIDGSAHQDGRLREGDMLLEVNGIDLLGKSKSEVTQMLKSFGHDEPVEFLISRQEDVLDGVNDQDVSITDGVNDNSYVCDNNRSLIDLDVPDSEDNVFNDNANHQLERAIDNILDVPQIDGPGIHVYDILVPGKSIGLHLIEILGIWIGDEISEPAASDGRLRPNDQILAINDISIEGKSYREAVDEMIRIINAGEGPKYVRFRIKRRSDAEIARILRYLSVKKKRNSNNQSNSNIYKNLPEFSDMPNKISLHASHVGDSNIEPRNRSLPPDGPGHYVYDIKLNDAKSAGLGIHLKYPTVEGKDLGVWIKNVITEGAAFKDGRLREDDQITAINGISLLGNNDTQKIFKEAIRTGVSSQHNTIRLEIHRRDPKEVKKILDGANNRIEPSDVLTNGHERLASTDTNDNSRDSCQTVLENLCLNKLMGTGSNNSSGSSNQYSQNDSVLSPQTQASNSLKTTTTAGNDHSSSDKTNDTSSAISQVTDYTNVPNIDNTTPDKYDAYLHCVLPKSLQTNVNNQNADQASTQSWDDESIDAATGEERFQRDGFGRQSISEKRHAQLMAKNTDTYRRNKQQREERERQRQLEEQLARQTLEANQNRRSVHLPSQETNPKIPTSYTTSEFKSIYGLTSNISMHENRLDDPIINYNREVPVDVHPQAGPIEVAPESPLKVKNDIQRMRQQFGVSDQRLRVQKASDVAYRQQVDVNHTMPHQRSKCPTCGSVGKCNCGLRDLSGGLAVYNLEPNYDQMLKRSNSLESVQQYQFRENIVVPRAGTVRTARNRKVNESFRVAVDRSYDGSANDSVTRYGTSVADSSYRFKDTKMSGSIANSTISTSNDEKYLINAKNSSNTTTSTKKSSLLTKFLKFGSMKRSSKKKNRDGDTKSTEASKPVHKDNISTSRESETTRSQVSSSSHSRTQSSQSHPNLSVHNHLHNGHHLKSNLVNGGFYQQNSKQTQQNLNGTNLHPVRASVPGANICHQYQPTMHNTQQQHQILQLPMTQAKYVQNVTTNRTANYMDDIQYSHIPMQHHQLHLNQALTVPTHNAVPQNLLASHMPAVSNMNNPHQQMRTYPSQLPAASCRNQSIYSTQVGINHQAVGGQTALAPIGHWQMPSVPVQAPNGLWVANSPVSEHQQMLQNNIYGTTMNGQSSQLSRGGLHQPHPIHHPSSNHLPHQPNPFMPPPINGHTASESIMEQRQYCPFTTTQQQQQQIHNQQPPQHIYYYDF